ncbi:MAG: FCD domain-containing protein [Actinomycetota bacterium]|nr:FCD domain-containing protein [Actinomycetota bacterium]
MDRNDRPGVTTRTARVLIAPVPAGGRGREIARRLEDAIRLGVLEAGARLPSETVLAEQFNVSPLTLREALALLRDRDLVKTRRGRGGGTFVLASTRKSDEHLSEVLRAMSSQEMQDLGDHRAAVSAAAARLAASRALDEDLEQLRRSLTSFDPDGTIGELRRADCRFHIEVAVAAQSPRLTEAEMSLWTQVGDLVWYAVAFGERMRVVEEHAEILRAIEQRDASAAHRLALLHADDETRRLLAHRVRVISAGSAK